MKEKFDTIQSKSLTKEDYIGGIVGISFMNGDKLVGKVKSIGMGDIELIVYPFNDTVKFPKYIIKRLFLLIKGNRKDAFNSKET